MTLSVHAWGAYASYDRQVYAWRSDDYAINQVVKALKGKPFNGYASVLCVDRSFRTVKSGDQATAIEVLSQWGAARILKLKLGQIAIVPVPSSAATTFGFASAPLALCNGLVTKLGKTAALGPWLRFDRKMPTSHEGGSRDQDTIQKALRVKAGIRAGTTVVLVDDVKTTGSHLRACANALRDHGCTVEHVIVAASTVWQPAKDPFKLPPEEIEDAL